MERLCERASLVLNRNSLPGDKSPAAPGGVRLGSCAMTTRGCGVKDFVNIGNFLLRAKDIALDIQSHTGKKLNAFTKGLDEDTRILKLRDEVETWASERPFPS